MIDQGCYVGIGSHHVNNLSFALHCNKKIRVPTEHTTKNEQEQKFSKKSNETEPFMVQSNFLGNGIHQRSSSATLIKNKAG